MKNLNNINYFNSIVKECESLLYFATDDLLNNKNFILEAIKTDYKQFALVNNQLKSDYKFTLRCVKIALQIAKMVNEDLLTNKNWICEAIRQNAECFEFLCKTNETFCKNMQLCLIAATRAKNWTLYSKSLFQNMGFVKLLVKTNPKCISWVIKTLENLSLDMQHQLCLIAIEQDASVFALVPQNIASSRMFIQRAIISNSEIKHML